MCSNRFQKPMEVFCKLSVLQVRGNTCQEVFLFISMAFFRIFLVEQTHRETHHNFSRKQNFLAEEHIKILRGSLEIRKISPKFRKFSCRTQLYLLNRLRFVNYMRSFSCRTPPKLPGAKHCENTYLVYAAFDVLLLLKGVFYLH